MAQDDQEQGDSLRDTLNAAIEEHEAPAETPEKEAPDETLEKGTPAETPEKGEPGKEPKDAKTVEEGEDKEQAKPEGRDKSGRFRKRDTKPEQKTEVKDETKVTGEVKKEEETRLPKSRAPGTWTPAAREHWGKLPPPVQQEILRRERDISNGFNEVGRIRQFGQQMHDTWAPFQAIIAAEGGDAVKMTRDLFVTAAALYHGSPESKVRTVASLINTFGIDIQMLDSALAGSMPKGDSAPAGPNVNHIVQQAVNQALAPFTNQQKAEEERVTQAVTSDIDAFAADPKNEWFMDVKDTMADLLELAGKRGDTMDLSTAYKRAILMHSDIADVMQERASRNTGSAKSAAAAAARKKAVSVTGAPANNLVANSETSNLRDDIISAMDEQET